MKQGLVSVIIPNYNYAQYLREAIDSVLAQTYRDIEVIVVDDGSKDDSRAVLESYGDTIKAIFQQNQGVAAARNNGAAASDGEYIAFLDADDAWLPTKIERQIDRFADSETLGLVHVGVDEVDSEGQSLVHRLEGAEGTVSATLLMLGREGVLGGGSGAMVRRAVFDEIGGLDERLSTSADWDMFYRVSERSEVGFVRELLVKYRVHGSNMHTNVDVFEHDMLLAFEKAFISPSPEIAAVRRKAYGSLFQILAGSYYYAGQYGAFVTNSLKSVTREPGNIRYFLPFLRRTANRRGVKVE